MTLLSQYLYIEYSIVTLLSQYLYIEYSIVTLLSQYLYIEYSTVYVLNIKYINMYPPPQMTLNIEHRVYLSST